MGFFDGLLGGGGASGALDAGRVEATVGYRHDRRGLVEWERAIADARRERDVETELRGDFDSRGFKEYEAAVARARAGSARGVGAAQKLESGILRVGKAGAYAGGVLGVAFVAGAYKSVEAASDLNESINASTAIFEKSSPAIQKWSKTTADGLGLARSESLQAAASIGAMLKPMGYAPAQAARMSKRMVQLAGDMASFNNEDPSEMLERIRSGLAGESEPLRRFGVDLRVSAVQAFALKEGLIEQGEALEGQALVQASYQKILADTVDQQGDFERTSTGLANVQRRLRANFIDTGAALGDGLLPYVREASLALNGFLVDMQTGSGLGGSFSRFLEAAGADVAGFVDELASIADDPGKSSEQKVREILERLEDVTIDGISTIVEHGAAAAGKAAPEIALAFVHGFLEAPILGKLLIANWAAKAFGGKTLLQRAGATMGASVAGGVPGGFQRTTSTSGFKGRMIGAFGGLKSVGKGIGATVLAFSVLDGLSDGISTASRGGNFEQSLHDGIAGAFATVGIDTGKTWAEHFSENLEEIPEQAQAMIDQLGDSKLSNAALRGVTGESLAELVGLPDGQDYDQLDDEQKAGLDQLASTLQGARKLFKRTGIKVNLDDVGGVLDPKKIETILGGYKKLSSGVYASYADIRKASRANAKTIEETLGKGTKAGRQAAAENLRATAKAFALQMGRSGDVTKKGLDRVDRLLRRADLIQGLHPEKFGREFANMFDSAEKVTKKSIDRMLGELGKLPKGQRQAAFDAMTQQLAVLRKNGKLSDDEYRKIRSGALAEFEDLQKGGTKSTKILADGALGNFVRLGIGIANVLETNKVNLNKALEAFNVDPVDYTVEKPKESGGGRRQRGGRALRRFERGGFLSGAGREDTVPILAAPEEAWLTGWHQGPVELGLAASKAMGLQPYGSLDELFQGDQRTHRTAPARAAVQAFATGGWVDPAGPGTGVVNPAIADVVGAWSQRYDAAINYGYDPGGGHVSPGHNVTGTATDTGPAAGWGSETGPSTTLFEQGLRAVLGAGLTVLYGSHGIGTPWPNHGWGNHAHIEWGMNPQLNGLAGLSTDLPDVTLSGPAGPFLDMGKAIAKKAVAGAEKYLASKAPAGYGGDTGLVGGGQVVRGKATWFTGGQMASGANTETDPGLALNPNPGGPDPGSWNNPTTQGWLAARQPFLVELGGHKAVLPVLDMGPAGWTGNAIDVDHAGVGELGFSTSSFPSGTVGTATESLPDAGGRRRKQRGGWASLLGRLFAGRQSGGWASEVRKLEKRIDVVKAKLHPQDPELQKRIDEIKQQLEATGGKAPSGKEAKELKAELKKLREQQGDPPKGEKKEKLEELLAKLEKKLAKVQREAKSAVRSGGLHETLARKLAKLNDRIAGQEETIDLAERMDVKATSPGGDELTPEEIAGEVGLNKKLLRQFGDRRELLEKFVTGLTKREKVATREIAETAPRDADDHYLLDAWKSNRASVRERLADARDQLEETIGITGGGGRLFDVQEKIDELLSTEAAGSSGSGDENLAAINELLSAEVEELKRDQLIRARQAPIFSSIGFQRGGRALEAIAAAMRAPAYGGNFGTGGTVPGPAGAPRTITAHGGEHVGRGEPKVDVYVTPGRYGPDVAVEVDGVLTKRVLSAGVARPFPSASGIPARRPKR